MTLPQHHKEEKWADGPELQRAARKSAVDWTQSKVYQRFGVQRDHITLLHPSPTRYNRKEKVSCHREITFDMSQAWGEGRQSHCVPSDLFSCVICNSTHNTTMGVTWVEVSHLFSECSLVSNHSEGQELWYLPFGQRQKRRKKSPPRSRTAGRPCLNTDGKRKDWRFTT